MWKRIWNKKLILILNRKQTILDSNLIRNIVIKKDIEKNDTKLIISKQYISEISMGLIYLQTLDLLGNQLREIKENAFIGLNNL